MKRKWVRAFSYVGACQVLMGVYIYFSHGLSWLVHSPLSFFLKEGSERSNMLSFLVLTSQTPRGAHSAIRAQEDMPPAHEISCASDDAHSRSRALDGESLAQKAARAVVPRVSLRGPAVQSSRGRACSVRFSFDDGAVHPGQKLAGDGHRGRLVAAALGDSQEDAPHVFIGADGGPGRLLQNPPQIGRAGLGDMADPLFSSRGEHPRIESGIAADRLGIGESLEVADFRDHGGGGHERHAGEAHQNLIHLAEQVAPNHFADGPLGLVHLPLGERKLINALPEHLHVPGRQLLALPLEVTDQTVALHAHEPGRLLAFMIDFTRHNTRACCREKPLR